MGQFDKPKVEEPVGAKIENIGDLPKENNNQAVEPVVVPSAEDIKAKEDAKVERKIEDEKKIEEIRSELMGKVETKKEYPEGHLMDPNLLDKIAQLEAIDWDTLEFSQKRYESYINSHFSPIIKKNQEKMQEMIDEGDEPSYYECDTMQGIAGLNRYKARDDGSVKLLRGGMVESGTKKYKEELYIKAKELGIKIQGQ